MKKLAQLRKEYADVKSEVLAINSLAKTEERDLTDEELATVNAKLDSIDGLKAEIEQGEKAEQDSQAAADVASRIDAIADLPAPARRSTPKAGPVGTGVEGGQNRQEIDPQRGFKNVGDFAVAVHNAQNPSADNFGIDQRLNFCSAAGDGVNQTVNSEGGFLMPPQFSTSIWDGMRTDSDSLLGRTDGFTVTGESLTIPAIDETSRATGSRWGGVQSYWVEEDGQLTSSKPTVRELKLEPHTLAVLAYVSRRMMQSPVALSQFLTRAGTDEINFMTGDAIINGDGVGKPQGILTSAATVSVAKETGQTAATVVKQNVDKMYARVPAHLRRGAVWLVNQDVEPSLQNMGFDVGNGGVPLFVPGNSLANAPFSTLKGLPIVPTEYNATLGTVGDIILAVMTGYASGTRGGIDSAMSIHLKFDYAQTAFRFMFDVDGQTYLRSPLTPFKGTNTLSHFVTLATRA